MPQNFSSSNLRHKSFADQNLTDANFYSADIRGTDFSGACLTNANFSKVKAGLPLPSVICLVIFSLFLALLSGLIAAYAGAVLGHLFATPESGSTVISIFVTILLILFGAATITNGLGFALGSISLIVTTAIVFIVAITPSTDIAGKTAVSSLALGGFIAGVVGLAEAINLNRLTKFNLAIALFGILCGGLLGVSEEEVLPGFAGVILVGTSVLVLATYIGQKALTRDGRYRLIHHLTINLSTFGGTRFCNANLTDANFTEAILHGTDFRGACLTRVRWLNAKLERANLDRTSLESPQIRQLLTDPIHKGVGKNLDHLDLQGVNLQDANLTDASLISADLTNANLQGADLSRSKLVQAQLYGANLTGVQLTGAYIENWGISPDTNLNRIQCDYIFMHLPTDQDPDPYRKPDNRQETFQEGEFANFIAPIIRTLDSYKQQLLDSRTPNVLPKTLDLLHREGIDPNAAAIALRQLIAQNPEAHVEILSIEGRSNQNIRIQARISHTADSDQLNRNYFQNYNQLKALTYPDLQQLLASFEASDASFRSLQSMVMSAIGSSKFYIETTLDPSLLPKTILILAANPRGTTVLKLDEEVREIQRDIERGKYRDRFVLQQRWAVQTPDIRRALLDYEPQILHFSGHGTGTESPENASQSDRDISPSPESTQETEGLIFEDETGQPKLVSIEALSNLFQLFSDRIECVILNACYSEDQAQAISQHIPYVIGMKRAIGDRAAIEFAIGFYDGILAGKSIAFAYKLGCSAIQTAGIPEHLTPVLKRKA
jgi:uncharacterized protein YjbI with pentapeptide repeats